MTIAPVSNSIRYVSGDPLSCKAVVTKPVGVSAVMIVRSIATAMSALLYSSDFYAIWWLNCLYQPRCLLPHSSKW